MASPSTCAGQPPSRKRAAARRRPDRPLPRAAFPCRRPSRRLSGHARRKERHDRAGPGPQGRRVSRPRAEASRLEDPALAALISEALERNPDLLAAQASREAARATASFEKLFWLEDRGWYADLLIAGPDQPAAGATVSDALRSNCLFPISLGVTGGERAQRCVAAGLRYLVVPGALRSLAPLRVSVALPIFAADGRLLGVIIPADDAADGDPGDIDELPDQEASTK